MPSGTACGPGAEDSRRRAGPASSEFVRHSLSRPRRKHLSRNRTLSDAALPAGLPLDTGEEQTTPRGKHAVQPGADAPGAGRRFTGAGQPGAAGGAQARDSSAGRGRCCRGGRVIWTAGAFGPGGPFTGLAGFDEPAAGSGSAQEARNGVESGPVPAGSGRYGQPRDSGCRRRAAGFKGPGRGGPRAGCRPLTGVQLGPAGAPGPC